jgi:hypothetical protein
MLHLQKSELLVPVGFAMPSKNVQKRKARPKRSIAKPGDDHELGLWIDYDLLRRHQGRLAQTIIHDSIVATNNRYLELADLALGNGKAKKKSKSTAYGGGH